MHNRLEWGRIQGIVLDAVGTLIKPSPSVSEVYTQAALRQGVVLDQDVVRSRFHSAFQSDRIHGAEGILSTSEAVERDRWREIVARVLVEIPEPGRAFEELWDHFGEPGAWRLFSDSLPTVKALREAGLRVCLGSNFDGRLRNVLTEFPLLTEFVDVVVVSSEVGYRKPHAAFFKAVGDRMGLAADQLLSVGDDLENDVRGAERAGLSALLLNRGGEVPLDVASIAALSDLLTLRETEA